MLTYEQVMKENIRIREGSGRNMEFREIYFCRNQWTKVI